MLRVPAIVMLLRSLYALFLAMCRDTTSPSAQTWLAYVRWMAPSSALSHTTEDAPLFWSVFLSACVSQCVTVTARSLQHITSHEDPSSFNLMSFGFFLYIHSYEQSFRPNAHVYLIFISRIVELLGLQLLQCFARPPISRLAFTSLLGISMSIHYVYTTWNTYEYPTIHATSRILEVLTVSIILLSVFLHALTMLIVDGRIQLRHRLFARTQLPRSTDDFSLAVLKLGTACLQATRHVGFSLEFQAVDAPLHTYVELYNDGSVNLEHSIGDFEKMESVGLNGLDNEVKDIHVMLDSSQSAPELASDVRGGDRIDAIWSFVCALWGLCLRLLLAGVRALSPYLPAAPAFVYRIPRYARLFWHGTNGEARREARIEEQAQRDKERERAIDNVRHRMHDLQDRQRRRQLVAWAEQHALHAPSTWTSTEDLDPVELLAAASDPSEDPIAFQDVLLKHMMRPDHAPPLTRHGYRQIAASSQDVSHREACTALDQARGPSTTWPTSAALLALSSSQDWALAQSVSDRQTRLDLLKLLHERRKALEYGKSADEARHERMRLCAICCAEERYVAFLLTLAPLSIGPADVSRCVIHAATY